MVPGGEHNSAKSVVFKRTHEDPERKFKCSENSI